MEERKPMYEFDLGFIGKVICSADTASILRDIVLIASQDAIRTVPATNLHNAYKAICSSVFYQLKSVGYYNELL